VFNSFSQNYYFKVGILILGIIKYLPYKQCAAVRIKSGLIIVPPQICNPSTFESGQFFTVTNLGMTFILILTNHGTEKLTAGDPWEMYRNSGSLSLLNRTNRNGRCEKEFI